jgi:hypothetical protein
MPGTRPLAQSESSLPPGSRLNPPAAKSSSEWDKSEPYGPEIPTLSRELQPERPRPAEPDPELLSELGAEPEASEFSLQSALEAALEMDNSSDDAAKESEAEEFLGNSPVFRSKGRPVKRKPEPAPTAQVHTAAAAAVLAIASEIATMGVPEAQRPRARAAMLDLAHHLDRHDLTWDAMREAVSFVMGYPAIARRVLPLLLPYLEDAA